MGIRGKEKAVGLAAVLCVLASLVGCQIVSPGVTYRIGTLEALIAATPEEVTGAAKSVVEEMNLILVSSESTGLDGKVVARTALKKTMTIDIKRQDKNVSHISIRMGTMGDQNTSLVILEKIKERLM